MPWIVEVTVKAVETEDRLGAPRPVPTGVWTYGVGAEGRTLAAAWANVEGEVHEKFLTRLEPLKGDA